MTTSAPGGDQSVGSGSTGGWPESGVWLDLSENEEPKDGLYEVSKGPPPHIDSVRRELALVVVIPLVALYAAVIIGSFWFPAEKVTALVAALSGLSSLAAAVIGFYFGQKAGGE